jgi:hypothetical protein
VSTFLQTTTNDLDFTAGRLTIVSNVAQGAAIKLRNRLQFFQGEWFLDTRLGFPYFKYVFVKRPNAGILKQILRQSILTTPGIVNLLDLKLELDRARRKANWTFRAQAQTGEVIAGGSSSPFIVETKGLA